MKITKTGVRIPQPRRVPTWVGLVLVCKNCGTEVEMEEGDTPNLGTASGGGLKTIDIRCPICDHTMGEYWDGGTKPVEEPAP